MGVDEENLQEVMDVEMIMENLPLHTSYGTYILLTSSKYGVYAIFLENLNACRPSEHPPVRGVDSRIQRVVLATEELRRHNKSEIGLSNANPARGHKEVPRSTGHHGDNTLLKPTGIQSATRSLPGPTIREHRKLITVLRRRCL